MPRPASPRRKPPRMTPGERTLRAMAAANTRWSNATREERLAQGVTMRANSPASLTYWMEQVDPNGTLDPSERVYRAKKARTAYMQRLSLKAQRAKAEQTAQRKAERTTAQRKAAGGKAA